jgi:DNA-3-methyladenine glycosylase
VTFTRLENCFFDRDVLVVAPELIGKLIVRRFNSGEVKRYRITETEAYRGEEDLACHACKGLTARTKVMYDNGGKVYVYLIYGMYWMLNFVCSGEGFPAAVLIRGVENFSGPGRVGRELQLDASFYGENLSGSDRIWVEEDGQKKCSWDPLVRVGVDYAGEVWALKKWRFLIKTSLRL